MSKSSRFKVLLGMVMIFLAGGMAGALVGARMGKVAVEERSKIENLRSNIMNLLKDKLSLRPEQIEIIEPMVERAGRELEEVHRDGAKRVENVIRTYHEFIANELDADQLPILREMERRRREEAGFTE